MWSLYEDKKELKPLKFSNGKSQEDIVKEVLDAIKQGHKIIFIHGVCGTGKSAIALNIAKELGRASIVVPIKNLQRQYEQDYMAKKYVYKEDGEKLNINMITGRNNHKCLYLDENKNEIKETRKIETNAKLFDIFKKPEISEKEVAYDESADNAIIPCKISIKERNIRTLKKYYRENPDKKDIQNLDLKSLRRLAVGPACPYWSPIFPASLKINIEAKQHEYDAVNGKHIFYERKFGCPYYQQFFSYLNADVILFNSQQYILETMIGRKPITDVEIIDECDEFLDNFATEGIINLNRLRTEATFIFPKDSEQAKLVDALLDVLLEIMEEARIHEKIIMPINKTKIAELIKLFTKNDYIDVTEDEDSYIEKCSELCRRFYEVMGDSYICFYRKPNENNKSGNEISVKLVTINLEKVFKNLLEKNKIFVMMSGTLHSEKVLKEIFGIKDFKIIEAEIINQGAIEKQVLGVERDFKYANFNSGLVTREQYLSALDKCVENAKRPCVVHVNAFQDLPSRFEIVKLNLKNLITSEDLISMQKEDKTGRLVKDFKKGKTDLLFTTRCNRGIDFPFQTCNSVVMTKFPYPNTQSLFWQILKKQKPDFFWDFYKDKAHRELLQRIYRSIRHKDDHIFLLSPDIRVLKSEII